MISDPTFNDVAPDQPTGETMLEMYRRMLLIRRFEEQVIEFMDRAEMVGGAHLSIGQEAAIVGACMALRDSDYMVGTHRSHGHSIAKGSALAPLMAELLGRRTGINKGKGGSMHLANFKLGSLGETSIVGSGLPIAVGGALSAKLRNTDQVSLVFFGDGAAQEGSFHESINLAAIWHLPTIFFCENNGLGMTTTIDEVSSIANIADRAVAYGIPGATLDGQDVIACWRATSAAVARARAGGGPTLLEAKTLRFSAHSYRVRESRTAEDLAQAKARDPLPLFRTALLRERAASEADLAGIEGAVSTEAREATAFARASAFPDADEVYTDLYANESTRPSGDPRW